ncbi:MAG: hypothetical protein ACKVPJ_06645 [Chitinophagales bacterium]
MEFNEHVSAIEGIGIYPVVSFSIFFIFFIALCVFVFKMNKNKIDTLSHLPLEEEGTAHSQTDHKTEII